FRPPQSPLDRDRSQSARHRRDVKDAIHRQLHRQKSVHCVIALSRLAPGTVVDYLRGSDVVMPRAPAIRTGKYAQPFLPMTRADLDARGWDAVDIVIVSGDAYVDHPAFGPPLIGRFLEARGFRVGIIAQPDWHSAEPFRALGRPRLFYGVAAGNLDSMLNRLTAQKKNRAEDQYSPGGRTGCRPDR